jgi:hypothetical protein
LTVVCEDEPWKGRRGDVVVEVRVTKGGLLGSKGGERKKTAIYEYIDFSLLSPLSSPSYFLKKKERGKKIKKKNVVNCIFWRGKSRHIVKSVQGYKAEAHVRWDNQNHGASQIAGLVAFILEPAANRGQASSQAPRTWKLPEAETPSRPPAHSTHARDSM